jgi:CheY-like chemotaxis protein
MEADKVPLVFDMFTQLDMSLERAYGGLGVGMALAKRLVEMHGGTIRASSPGLGRGSRFTVSLPVAQPPVDHAPADGGTVRAAPARRHRVLVVDDNRDFAVSLGTVLEFNGHEVRLAFDGASGLAQALEFRPEIAFLDLGLPGLSGFDLARRLRADPTTRAAMLVALTGWGQDKDRAQSSAAGFDVHFVKPVDPEAIARLADEPAAARGEGTSPAGVTGG